MIDRLVRDGVIRTPRVLEAFRAVPRHAFLSGVPLDEVYSGRAIPVRFGPDGAATSSSSMPAIMAIMIEQLDVRPGHRILEIGAGTGYNAAILAHLAGPEGAVTTVDIDPEVARTAEENLKRAAWGQVDVQTADGWGGGFEHAPYDRIEVTVGAWDLSPHWLSQLREGGILVVPLWLRAGLQASIAFRRQGEAMRSLSVEPCGFMRLRGPHAGPERYVRLNGWEVTLEGASAEAIEVLRDLCETFPRRDPAPDLRPGWFLPIALEEPGAITLSRWQACEQWAAGIFDCAERSLAIVAGGEILTFGGYSARLRLGERLAQTRPINLRALQVDAIPATRAAGGRHAWVLPREHFLFALSV
jgi:protein-L-isoaspartate(D-aspartate) O-methyltransferase